MKNNCISSCPLLNFRPILALLFILLLTPFSGKAQTNITITTANGYMFMQGLPGPGCGNQNGVSLCTNCGGTPAQQASSVLQNTPVSKFLLLKGLKNYTMTFLYGGNFPWNYIPQITTGSPIQVLVTLDGGASTQVLGNLVYDQNFAQYRMVLNFPNGTTSGSLVIPLEEYDNFTGTPVITKQTVIIPFIVEGVVKTVNNEVPILGDMVSPSIPFLILHDPPGDGSSSEFQEMKTTCRSFSDSYTVDEANNVHAAVKLGVAGSIGFVATIDFEFSVEFSGGLTVGTTQTGDEGSETCITTTEGFSTSDLPGAEDGQDVFIGYGMTLYYGKYQNVEYDRTNCTVGVFERLIYAPKGVPRKFIYTKDAILTEIANLQLTKDDTTKNTRQRNEADNQIDVWNQVLQLNDENINNLSNDTLASVSFSALANSFHESSISIVDTKTITTEQYIDGTAGLELVLSIGGSGVSGGYEYSTSKRYGKTTSTSQDSSKVLRYTLADDDSGDIFYTTIVRDPMFGTPIFRRDGATASSCPFEGGYQRDQPLLKHSDISGSTIILEGNPVGTSATFKTDICNNSNEPRTYNLKLNAQSNLNGAVITVIGVPLNGNDLGQEFTVPANSCLEDVVVNVAMLNGQSPLSYPKLELFLYSPCDPEITSSIFASVYFGDATSGLHDPWDGITDLQVFPNPAKETANVSFHLLEPTTMHIGLYDMTGRLLTASREEQLSNGDHQKEINVAGISPGLYVIKMQCAEGIISKTLVVE